MARKKDINKIRDGFGQGDGPDYKPFLRSHDFPSDGRTHRIWGNKINRIHTLFSDLERKFFFLFEHSKVVTEIKEQFPLDVIATTAIANELKLKHPKDTTTGTPYTMTTDFLLEFQSTSGKALLAISIKPSGKIDNNALAKMQIEKKYWNSKGIKWCIMTEKQLPEVILKNISESRRFYKVDHDHSAELLEYFISTGSKYSSLNELIREFCHDKRILKEHARNSFLSLVANHKIEFDLSVLFKWTLSPMIFKRS